MKKTKYRGRARGRLPQISDAEWLVMKVVWSRAPVTANQVVAALAAQTDWKPKTVHTLLRRLAAKGAIEFEKQGREHLFSPRVEEGECVRAESRSFIERVFGGEPAAFLARFLEEERLAPEEVEELKRILERKQP